MSKNPQLDASKASLETSKEYLAIQTEEFHKMLAESGLSRDEKTRMDDIVKRIQHYSYRVALSNHSVKLAETLQNVYLGCSDPTGSKAYWMFNGEKKLEEMAKQAV